MLCTLRHQHHNNANNNNNKKPKLPQPSSTNTDPPTPSTTKSPPATRRNFLSANPAATASYNQQIADTINSYKASNNNIHLHQEIITSILQAVNKLHSVPVNNSIADPITMDKLKSALKKAKYRKAPGPNGIIIKQYKLLDDSNLTFILDILNNYVEDPDYDIPAWHEVSLKLLPKRGAYLYQRITI